MGLKGDVRGGTNPECYHLRCRVARHDLTRWCVLESLRHIGALGMRF